MNKGKCAINAPITKRGEKTGLFLVLANVMVEQLQKQNFGQSVSNAAAKILTAQHFRIDQLHGRPDWASRLKHRKVHHFGQGVEYRVRCSLIEID